MASIEDIAPSPTTGGIKELIEPLWEAFKENFDAFKEGKMKLEDEAKYNLFSAPGPAQYNAFAKFFDFFEDGEAQIHQKIGTDKTYAHDFGDTDKQFAPAILGLLKKLHSSGYSKGKDITMVSGFFWNQDLPSRKKIIALFKKLSRKDKAHVRIVTRAKQGGKYLWGSNWFLTKDSRFNIPKRVPFHYVLAEPDYLFFEFPHTESSILRLNMLLDLNTMQYKDGKTKADLLNFLDSMIEEAL